MALEITGAESDPDAEFRGFGVASEKSVELFPASVAPPPARKMAVVAEGDGAAALPS